MRLLIARLDYEEQMFPNWHFCYPGVYSTQNSFFAFHADTESETPPLAFAASDARTALAAPTPVTHLELRVSVRRRRRWDQVGARGCNGRVAPCLLASAGV